MASHVCRRAADKSGQAEHRVPPAPSIPPIPLTLPHHQFIRYLLGFLSTHFR